MDEYEQAVIEAAVEYRDFLHALDCGCPAQEAIKKSHDYLIKKCDELAAENDGRWRPD